MAKRSKNYSIYGLLVSPNRKKVAVKTGSPYEMFSPFFDLKIRKK
jgi:hypothetical protein